MKFIPGKPQEKMILHALRYAACAIWASMGIGKTSAMLYVISAILILYGGPILIIAPKKVACKTWPDEFKKFDDFRDIEIVNFAKGDLRTRQSFLRSIQDICKVEVCIVNYENVQWLEERLNINFSLLILDESTRIKNFRLRKGSKRAKSILKLRKQSQRIVELTGTPAPNGIMDLWGQIFLLDLGKRLGRTITAFREKWFNAKFRPTHTEYTPKENAVAGISEQLKDICLVIRSEDYYDLKEPIERDIHVELPDKVKKIYKELEKDMYTQLRSGADIDVTNAADISRKCMQCASGAIYTNKECSEWEELHTEKLDALESIIEEAGGMPVLVCYHFRHEAARLIKRFPHGRRLRTEIDQDEWNAGRVPLMWLHPASAGHGINLQYGGNIIVYFTSWWDFEQDAQAFERIGPMRQLQAGFKRNVFRYNIICDDTVDLRVKMAREYKLSVNEALKTEVM